MATLIVVMRICDVCGMTTEEESDVAKLLITERGAEFEVDVCKVCYAANPLTTAMRQVKKERKNAAKAKKVVDAQMLASPELTASGRPRTEPCTVKGCDFKAADQRGISRHMTVTHGKKR